MQIFERSDGVRVEAEQFTSFEVDLPRYSKLIDWLGKHGIAKTQWHAERPTDEWEEGDYGELFEIVDVEHLILIKDDLEAGVDAAGVEHTLVVKDGYEVRVDVGDFFVLRDGDVYSMAPEIFDAIFTAVITDDTEDWVWLMGERLPYSETLGYWRHRYDNNLISTDGGVTYWLESERRNFHATAESIHTSIKKESIV